MSSEDNFKFFGRPREREMDGRDARIVELEAALLAEQVTSDAEVAVATRRISELEALLREAEPYVKAAMASDQWSHAATVHPRIERALNT